jgi:hypothetical protein
VSLYLPIRNGMNLEHLCLYVQNLLSVCLLLFQSDISDARKNCHNDSETNPLLVPLTYIAGKTATHLGDSKIAPKSCLDVVLKLLTNRSDTSSMTSPPEFIRLLQSQLQAGRCGSARLLLQVQSLWKINEKSSVSIDAM